MGFEPTTSAVTGRRSNQLSHRAIRECSLNKTHFFVKIREPSRTKFMLCTHSVAFNVPSKPHIESSFPSESSTKPFWISPRPISNSQLHALLHFHLCPIYLVVFKGSYFFRMGYLILRGASRLDAFSVYPFQTWLPGHGLSNPTGPPAVRPSRSSRTKDSSSQISYAHAG